MTKNEFMRELERRLAGLSDEDIARSVEYYSEIIDDAVEEGVSEEDAVASLGTPENIATQILSEIPLSKIVKDKIKKRRVLRTWEIILLILGAPLWLSLLIAVFSVIFSVYFSLWSVIICLWAAFASVIGSALGGVIIGVCQIISGSTLVGAVLVCAGLVLAGVSIFMYYLCKLATKCIILLSKVFVVAIKKCFIKKGYS